MELAKFESIVLDERKAREKELMERRMVLQKKQQQSGEMDRTQKEKQMAEVEAAKAAGEDSMQVEVMKMHALINEEHSKISAYEAAFQQIKEATGVTDVNEVTARGLTWRHASHCCCAFFVSHRASDCRPPQSTHFTLPRLLGAPPR